MPPLPQLAFGWYGVSVSALLLTKLLLSIRRADAVAPKPSRARVCVLSLACAHRGPRRPRGRPLASDP